MDIRASVKKSIALSEDGIVMAIRIRRKNDYLKTGNAQVSEN